MTLKTDISKIVARISIARMETDTPDGLLRIDKLIAQYCVGLITEEELLTLL